MSNLLVLTAFGPFGDVSRNPSQELLEEISTEISNNLSLPGTTHFLSRIIPVSVEDCEDSLKYLEEEITRFEGINRVISVHLGVDARASFLKLELFGYNNMTFRIPDIRGFQPSALPIDQENQFDQPLQTSLPLKDILTCLQEKEISFQEPQAAALNATVLEGKKDEKEEKGEDKTDSIYVNDHLLDMGATACLPLAISTDPGRFLCNYLYYRSLSLSSKNPSIPASRSSLFVHVPPFQQIPRERQKAILMSLFHSLLS